MYSSILKKTVLTLTFVVLIAVMLWGFFWWSVVKKSEEQLSHFLQESFHDDALNSIDAELLQYKVGLTGAKASIKVSSKIEVIEEQMGELYIQARLINGPVFYNDGAIHFGKAMWMLSLDASLNKDKAIDSSQDKLQEIITPAVPFMSILVDFEDHFTYHSHIKNLSTASIDAEHIISDGSVSSKALENEFSIHIRSLSLMTEYGAVEIPTMNLSVKVSKQRTEQRKKIIFSTDSFMIDFPKALSKQQTYTADIDGNLFYLNNLLSGLSNVRLEVKKTPVETEKSQLEVSFHKLSVEGYQSFLFAEAEIFNLYEQVQWTLEENAETPEGQDHIWHLYDRLADKNKQLAKIITQKLFFSEQSKLEFSLDLAKHNESVPTFFKRRLSTLVRNNVFNQDGDHYQLALKSQNGSLMVNNNSMAWDIFIQQFLSRGTN